MPELPEVETVRITLKPIIGAKITSLWWSGKNLRLNAAFDLKGVEKSVGCKIESISRLGKYLILYLQNSELALLVHLGMSGRFRYFPKGSTRPAHTHVEWELADGRLLRFTDPRRFGQVECIVRGKEREHASLGKLGPDPVNDEISVQVFYEKCQRTRRPIKVALLDQSLVAGIGNIYASEALWSAKIHPERPANTLSKKACKVLIEAVREVLTRALSHGGTSLKDFVAADGHAGQHSHYLWVYDREGQGCPKASCTSVIKRIVQQNRASFLCTKCQRK